MRTALDSNVLSAIWSREKQAESFAERLFSAQGEGALVLSPAAYSELLAHPSVDEAFVWAFLNRTGITVDFRLADAGWTESGRRYARYTR
jgi:uncharacterized protein with PIN domain